MNKKRIKRVTNSDWKAIPANVRQAINLAWANGMPPLSSAVYGRWWQLESWLRSLIYVELRAELGASWVDVLPKHYQSRQNGDDDFRYMKTPDSRNLLAYTDAAALFKITLERWDLFKYALLSKNVWAGRVDELLAIRNRIGHCRRPHADDLSRLEQTLRDLNGGAFRATSSFNNQWPVEETWTDALTDGWLRGRHEAAARLINHARRQYDTTFVLRYSRRPWAPAVTHCKTISGTPGYLWHASWHFRGWRGFDLENFWRDIETHADRIFMVCTDSPHSVSVSFSAMEDPAAVSDIIGNCFDAALFRISRGPDLEDLEAWQAQYAEVDPIVHVATPWTAIDESMNGVSIFSA